MRTISSLHAAALLSLLTCTQALAFKPFEPTQTDPFLREVNTNISSEPSHVSMDIPAMGERVMRVSNLFFNGDLADYMEVDSKTGTVRLLEGNIVGAEGVVPDLDHSSYLSAIKAYLDTYGKHLNLKMSDLVANDLATYVTDDHQFFKFDVTRGGVTVTGAQVDFRFRKGKLFQIVNQSFTEASSEDMVYSAEETKDFGERSFLAGTEKLSDVFYQIAETKTGYKLIPVRKYSTHYMGQEVTFEVSLSDKKIFQVKPKHFHTKALIQGYSRTYRDDPLNVPYIEGTLFDEQGAIITTKNDGQIDPGSYFFNEVKGLSADITSKDKKVALKNAQAISEPAMEETTSFIVNPWKNQTSDDTWAAYGTVYGNITVLKDLMSSTVKTSLGSWFEQPAKVNVNINSQCNAYWDGDTLNFFQASSECSNTANLGEVVLHEFGHGLDDNTGGIDDGAYSEGYGDLLAFSVYFSPFIGEGFYKEEPTKYIRNLSEFKSYPEDAQDVGVHQEGLIIGNTMYDLYMNYKDLFGEDLAKAKFREYVYTMIISTKLYTDVHNYIMAFEENDSYRCVANKVFTDHGLAKIRPACN